MEFYINGSKVPKTIAQSRFMKHWQQQGWANEDIAQAFASCLIDESARDDYLPEDLEMVAD